MPITLHLINQPFIWY